MKRLCLLLLPLAAFAAAPASDWSPNLTASAIWVGNASNGEAVWDRIATLDLSADVLASSRYQLGRFDVGHASLHLAGDWFPRYLALDRAMAGVRLDWQHTFGAGRLAPVGTIEAGGDAVTTAESARRGTIGAVSLKLEQNLGRNWHAAIRENLERYGASSAVFDSRRKETNLEISHDLDPTTRVVLTGIYRDGDIVTYAQYHRPDLVALAHASAGLKTFHQTMTAYATDARSTGGRLALVHAVSEEAAAVLAYEYTSTRRPGLKFENQLITLSLVRQY